MKALVTGCAGFIGSNLTDRLLDDGYEVIGIDRFSDYYPRKLKEMNLRKALTSSHFQMIEEDILSCSSLPDVDYVFHCAAQAGVRASWGKNFDIYIKDNIQVTQHLLEQYKEKNINKFIYSSSSSVYGDIPLPMREDAMVQPVSPYGVTKLAGEHLCYLYWKNYGIPTISLRYFTVYGPRQRPDMGIYKFVNAIINSKKVSIFGNGSQTRDFTYVEDVVQANILAATCSISGEAVNIGGENQISVNDLIVIIEKELGDTANVHYYNSQKGDVSNTFSDIRKAKELLNWKPQIEINEGINRYILWIKGNSDIHT